MLHDIIRAPRTDAIYNMHGYLTKVPVQAIIPLIEEFSPERGLVVDMFAGSGMTAIAAKMSGRNAVVSDISKLGQHIGTGYLTEVSQKEFVATAENIVAKSKTEIGWIYETLHHGDNEKREAVRAVWSFVYQCPSCARSITYYLMLKDAGWDKGNMTCPFCHASFDKRKSQYMGDEPVLTVVKRRGERQVEQPFSDYDRRMLERADAINAREKIPNAEITADREMYYRSALKKWNITNTKDFFSQRNAAVLLDIWQRIQAVDDFQLKSKLLFVFTAILPRASKRYQWSHKAPLNAANQNYYIAPVFYEWNVYDLFMRKVSACVKSDAVLFANLNRSDETSQEYVIASADNLSHLEEESADFVFTDPPFGSNIFYSDMNLFQEAWLSARTEHSTEAVIRTTGAEKDQSAARYLELLTGAFREAYRVLKPGGVLSIVFGNSKGNIWAMAQEAFRSAGFTGKPVRINILDKGQRSVKGLASGSESVATLDLIVSLRKGDQPSENAAYSTNTDHELIREVVKEYAHFSAMTASHIYLEVLRQAIYENRNVGGIDLGDVLSELEALGFMVDPSTGVISKTGV